jgi:hypothetical protein
VLVDSDEISSDLDVFTFVYECFAWFAGAAAIQTPSSLVQIWRILNSTISIRHAERATESGAQFSDGSSVL